MNEYLDLFLTFARIGVSTFGGGAAMLPLLERELVDNKKWVSEKDLMDYYAIGQCTPGIIAVNVATFVGKKTKGNLGGIIATLGIVFPSLVIITVIAKLIENFSTIEWVQHAFAGIRVAVCALIVNAVVKLAKNAIIDKATLIIAILVALGSIFLDLSPIVYVCQAAIAGIVLRVNRS